MHSPSLDDFDRHLNKAPLCDNLNSYRHLIVLNKALFSSEMVAECPHALADNSATISAALWLLALTLSAVWSIKNQTRMTPVTFQNLTGTHVYDELYRRTSVTGRDQKVTARANAMIS
jgi:hypothetical protein